MESYNSIARKITRKIKKIPPIVLYTHSEYSFLWKATIPLLEKYASDLEIHWCCDTLLDYKLPSRWFLHLYDLNANWSERVKNYISSLSDQYIIYVHEDWLLIDSIHVDILEYLVNYMNENECNFLMSYTNGIRSENIKSSLDDYDFVKIHYHWLQPAIWSKDTFVKLCNLNPQRPVDAEGPGTAELMSKENCYAIINTKFEKDISTRTIYYPHIHAINRGNWTFLKYPFLKAIVESYGVDTTKRGVDDSWIVEYK